MNMNFALSLDETKQLSKPACKDCHSVANLRKNLTGKGPTELHERYRTVLALCVYACVCA